MKLWSDSFKDGNFIPGEFAFCIINPITHASLSTNRNPHLAWSDVPAGTKSLALICCDVDVPSSGDDVNQEGKTIPVDLPRVDFFHWAMVDMPADATSITAGEFSADVIAHGKPGPEITSGPFFRARHGINDYTGWFAGDANMAGDYFGYDGPCPPWNDAIVHRYVFTLYALDIDRLPVVGNFTGQQVLAEIKDHILAEARIVGLYTLNPDLAEPSYKKAPPQ